MQPGGPPGSGQTPPSNPPVAAPPAAAPPAARAHAAPPRATASNPSENEILFEGRARHSAILGTYLKWVGLSALGGAAAFGLNAVTFVQESGFGAYLWSLAAVGTPGLLWAYLVHVNQTYKVSRRRVETEKGVFARKVDSLELWRVLDIQYGQSFLDRILGNAKVSLQGTDQSHPMLVLHGLPGHRKLFEELREAIQLARHTSRPMELVPGQDMDGGMSEIVG